MTLIGASPGPSGNQPASAPSIGGSLVPAGVVGGGQAQGDGGCYAPAVVEGPTIAPDDRADAWAPFRTGSRPPTLQVRPQGRRWGGERMPRRTTARRTAPGPQRIRRSSGSFCCRGDTFATPHATPSGPDPSGRRALAGRSWRCRCGGSGCPDGVARLPDSGPEDSAGSRSCHVSFVSETHTVVHSVAEQGAVPD